MINITAVIIIIALLFSAGLILRSFTSLQVCALCGAVVGTWIGLLGAHFAGMSVDSILIGLLIGGSIVGSMYVLEERLADTYNILKLPFYLTLVSLAYYILGGSIPYISILLLAIIWIITLIIFKTHGNPKIKTFAQELINCCKNW